MTYYKLFRHDRRSPIQTDSPIVWDGSLPFDLPVTALDTSDQECSRGWNWVENLAAGFQIASLWPAGRPSIVVVGEPSDDVIRRLNKHRSSGGRLVRMATEDEIRGGVFDLSRVFGEHQSAMVTEQLLWREALARPLRDQSVVIDQLSTALEARGLPDWGLREFPSARNMRAAWDEGAAQDTVVAQAAVIAWGMRNARAMVAARAAWASRNDWFVWAAWDTWDTWVALTNYYAALTGWTDQRPDLLTVGLREAYRHGLGCLLPTGPNELGYVMAEALIETATRNDSTGAES